MQLVQAAAKQLPIAKPETLRGAAKPSLFGKVRAGVQGVGGGRTRRMRNGKRAMIRLRQGLVIAVKVFFRDLRTVQVNFFAC